MSDWKFGQVVKWRDQDIDYDPEPVGRFLVIGPTKERDLRDHVDVLCLVAAPDTDWDVGVILPCLSREFELADD